MAARQVKLDGISFANDRPFVLLGGVNVLEDLDFTLRCAGHYKQVCERLGIPLVFKASYDKANRSSIHSFRGPGLDEGLANPAGRQDLHGIPVITTCTVLRKRQRPQRWRCDPATAFLARQTDLVRPWPPPVP
ncbi:MAG: hypothetical protein CM15mP116_00140 [Synechococcus sp.]|nr:MAG: hypothetical protein CM15mP116_00140 [Synechococcus sp.]